MCSSESFVTRLLANEVVLLNASFCFFLKGPSKLSIFVLDSDYLKSFLSFLVSAFSQKRKREIDVWIESDISSEMLFACQRAKVQKSQKANCHGDFLRVRRACGSKFLVILCILVPDHH